MTTKQKVAIILIILSVAFMVGVVIAVKAAPAPTVPQTPQAYTMQGTAAHTTCTAPSAGAYFLCVATDGIWVSNNGAAYFQIVPQAASSAPALTLNGVTKTLPASFTISSAAPTGSVTIGAPPITANAPVISAN